MNEKSLFATRLTAMRKEKNISQYEFAEMLGIARSTYSGYESEGKQPDVQMIGRIARMLDTTTDYLIGVSSDPRPNESVFTKDCLAYKSRRDELPPEQQKVADELFDDFYMLVTRPMMDKRYDKLGIYAELFSRLREGLAEMTLNASDARLLSAESVAAFVRAHEKLKNALAETADKIMELELLDKNKQEK